MSGAIALLLVWAAVAHASGSGWVQALGTLAAGIMLVGMLGPRWAVRRIHLTVEDVPADASVGQPIQVTIASSRPCRCTPIRPKGTTTLLQARQRLRVELTLDHRGVLAAIEVRVSSAAPLGLLWWSARQRLDLPRILTVAPARGAQDRPLFLADPGDEGRGRSQLAHHGEMRGVRRYRLGDSPRQVHWRSSAHTGSLMVRELETQPELPVRVVADLPDDPEAAEQQASDLMGQIASLLERHRRVILDTIETSGKVSAAVADERSGGRRLARAGQNPWSDLGPAASAAAGPSG